MFAGKEVINLRGITRKLYSSTGKGYASRVASIIPYFPALSFLGFEKTTSIRLPANDLLTAMLVACLNCSAESLGSINRSPFNPLTPKVWVTAVKMNQLAEPVKYEYIPKMFNHSIARLSDPRNGVALVNMVSEFN